MVKLKNYKEHILEKLQDPKEATAYLNAALQDGDTPIFLLALRDLVGAQGGMSKLPRVSIK
jgi:DNA-binding phage protein